ncbi:MAG: endonuclease/exonuclease/phosphatase family protein [Haliscomenobacter sp.]|nr:endonuclease/exonuclease/phosphatase family protein [Haliscomenobacter sp.]MBK7474973.1 endonuclease/exonuclease/phosphatase family protein [Haliscomenobacter sp.]MBK8880422.1 endonuclease/exonuclease/phosphatase family protein [Haliscomenobacter sp.]
MPVSVNSLLRSGNFILSGLTFAAYAASYFSPYTYWPLAFLGLIYPWLALANLGFIFVWLVRKRKIWALLSVFTLLLGWSHFKGLIGLHWASGKGEEGLVQIMSYNVRRFQPYGQETIRKISNAEWEASLKRHRPDILCVQEIETGPGLSVEAICQSQGLVYQEVRSRNELAIFSKYPILRTGAHMFNSYYGFQHADLQVGDRILRVYNVHLQSNAITGIAARIAQEGDLKEKRTWKDIRGMLGRYRRAAKIRQEQAVALAAHLHKSPYPVILCGDLNDVPQSFVYHKVCSGLQDAFQVAGKGLGVTYAGPVPGLRIDVILASSSIKVEDCRIGRREFSDHLPVVARVTW